MVKKRFKEHVYTIKWVNEETNEIFIEDYRSSKKLSNKRALEIFCPAELARVIDYCMEDVVYQMDEKTFIKYAQPDLSDEGEGN